jgi:hypothetical protein
VLELGGGRGSNAGFGIAFLVAAGIVFEIIAYCCSSPQTTELNALTRASTLMKWVHIGQIQAAVFIAFAAAIDRERRVPILLGGVTAMVISEGLYLYAKDAGLKHLGPPTEQHAVQQPAARRPSWGRAA